ncbi:MAG: hypothetical protein L0332_09990 [Chloroflexi bacterium]|nr:hypothetical protein [Chloroflexota bacterium]MCI0578879.1 hypothetical protein [Chloroflexota bacterium]MCI0649120.1 hypothetical protein [Chloroflexota bacterium]MCI0727035.1 hypothetical protein [Chloroflexota bacterium]
MRDWRLEIDETIDVGVEARTIVPRWPAVRYALVIFLGLRLFLAVWAVIMLAIDPLPAGSDEVVRPYLGEPRLDDGLVGLLLGPWQRFDTMHYLRIARQGYTAVDDSVFPPLYPLAMRGLGASFSTFLPEGAGHLLAGLLLSSAAFIALLALLYQVTAAELDERSAARTVVYLVLFPTGFFLLAAYTESIFILLALGSLWSARRGRFWLAGLLGFLAALTRLTGWGLAVPLAYEYARQQVNRTAAGPPGDQSPGYRATPGKPGLTGFTWRGLLARTLHVGAALPGALATILPPLGLMAFLAGRQLAGLPPIAGIYRQYWHQTAAFPGADLVTAVRIMLAGEAAFTLYFDFLCILFLLGTTVLVFRRLGPAYGLYSTMLLLFMLLPTSELKPLFSFSRYVLAFFPTFMLLGEAGRNPWINRLILYPSLALYLYFSGQFFIWGWVA